MSYFNLLVVIKNTFQINIRRACVRAPSKDIQKNGPNKCERTSLRKQLRAGGEPALHYNKEKQVGRQHLDLLAFRA